MKRTIIQRTATILGIIIGTAGLTVLPAGALSQAKAAATGTAADQARVQRIINRGNSEIARRLSTLNTLSTKISSATKLTDADKASLTNEVTTEISGLNSLKAKLDADTTVSDAKTDAQSIISDYRVYVLIVPKVNLIKTADDQQVAEGKLSDLATKLQTRLDTAKAAGHNVTSLQDGLANLNSQVGDAQVISSSIETAVISLQPTNYNNDHSVLSGDRDKLKTAQTDIQNAISDAKVIVNGLKNL